MISILYSEIMNAGDLKRATKDLVSRCLAKFDDTSASLDLRAFALSIVVSQISNGNGAMLTYVPEIFEHLRDSSILTLTVSGTEVRDFHRQVISAVSVVIDSLRENLVDGWFGPVVQYLVQLIACQDLEIADLACEFWSNYSGIPVAVESVRESWMEALEPQLPKLITALMDQMVLRENVEISSFETLRQPAAKALESVTKASPELVCSTFIPLLEMRIKSDSWSEKEAAIRAFRAFTNASGE